MHSGEIFPPVLSQRKSLASWQPRVAIIDLVSLAIGEEQPRQLGINDDPVRTLPQRLVADMRRRGTEDRFDP